MRKCFKKIYKKNWKQKMMTWLLMWLNVSVVTLNVTFQLLITYSYRYRLIPMSQIKYSEHSKLFRLTKTKRN